ncbi:MAG: DUF2922 domain-containing protein [Thermovenabulum sp.]|uniref:DUF2922 domain-containing protein n=1 Tax=Thermovenabulum sp. TaxID=3100335 RepID=UPI003C7AA481
MTSNLELSFQNTAGKTVRITLQEPKQDLTPENVQNAMNLILSKNIFSSTGGDLVKALGARIVVRDVIEVIPSA